PSDYAEAPRPVIVSKPLTEATKGIEYRYPVAVVRSLGDLRTRVVNGKETMSFWDLERPRFRIEKGPKWLSVDERTGRLKGTPDRLGNPEVVVNVTLEREDRRLDEASLKWGIEKVVSSSIVPAGQASQRFVVTVGP